MKTDQENLVVACHHILNSLKAGENIEPIEVMEDTFTCESCAKNEPRTEKEFMDMFVTLCRCCLNQEK